MISTLDIDPSAGGIQAYAYEVAKFMAQAGDAVIVLSAQETDLCRSDRPVPFLLYQLWPSFLPWWPLATTVAILNHIYLVVRHRVQAVLVTHWRVNGLAAWMCWKLLSVPYCVTAHAREIRDPKALGKRLSLRLRCMMLVLRDARKVLAVSRYTRRRLIDAGIPACSVVVIPNGVDVQRFSVSRDRTALRASWQLSDAKVILTVGRLVKRKGHDVVIRAMPYILDQVPQAVYLVGGTGPEEECLRRLAEGVGVSDKVRFLGHVLYEDLPSLYQLADVFLMPCREIVEGNLIDAEGFGIVLLEAAACGCSVIAGRSGGVEDAVVDGGTGLLVDPLDVNAVANLTIRLLTDIELSTQLGNCGRARAEQEFAWDKSAAATRKMLERVVDGASG